MGERADNVEQQPAGPSFDRGALLAIAVAVVGAIVGGVTIWFLGRSLREIEALAALMLVLCGLVFDLRCVIHLRLGYLWFSGNPAEGWTRAKRRLLSLVTLVNIGLSLGITTAGIRYLQHPGRFWQVGVTLVLLALMVVVVEATRRLIDDGGPKCGADVIENCAPVRAFLHPERGWNGKWGVDSWVKVVQKKIPVGSRNKAAVLVVLGIAISLVTQTGVVVGRVIKGSDHHVKGNHHSRHHVSKEAEAAKEESEGEADLPQASSSAGTCGTEVTPGDGAPEPLRAEIRRAWREKAPASGCARRARPNPSGSAYLVPGECQGLPWSLGIASWEHPSGVLLEDAAAAARTIGHRQELIGASERVDLAGGDFHLIFTPVGPYLIVREQKTDGHGGLNEPPESCAEIEPGKSHYFIIPPGMAELWIRLNSEIEPTWPVVGVEGESSTFVFKGLDHQPRAWGSCDTPVSCEIHGPGFAMESSAAGVQQVTVLAVLESGPR